MQILNRRALIRSIALAAGGGLVAVSAWAPAAFARVRREVEHNVDAAGLD